MMTMKKIALIASMGWMALSVAHAQQDSTLNRTVVVENQYNPTIMDASKVNVLPKVEEPVVPKTMIDYSTSVRPLGAWNNPVLSAMTRDWKSDAAYRGHFRAGYGNNGNVDVKAGYLWNISKDDRLNVEASLDGWNGELADVIEPQDWKSRLYNTRLGLDYKHAFKKMDLMLGGSYRSQVFNYVYRLLPGLNDSESFSDKQHQTLGQAYIGFASTDKGMPIQFAAEAGIKSFSEKYPILKNAEKNKETNLYLKGDAWKQLQDSVRLGLMVNIDNYAYASAQVEDWMAIEGNPYYYTRMGDWRVRVGAHFDWVGGENGKFHISPDIHAEYVFSDSYVLFAKAEGGRKLSSFYELTDMTPYFYETYINPTYMALDAAIGLKASPMNGWWFLLSGGYQIRENDVCLALGQGYPYGYARNVYGDTKVFYGTAELKYDYKDLLDFSLKGTYYNWEWENSDWTGGASVVDYALSLKPELELNVEAGYKAMEGLRINAGYEYVKRCDGIYDPVNNLYVGADYVLLQNLSVFAKVNNLLNKGYVRANTYPDQKLNFLAGLSLQF
jgi:hypothetical protein